ncbi:unnamed protein product [Arctia plantaginis]|uniref:Uncharacterized protein n=1 Tax=Arctia plantaginis TaxID=874455 RepID=A0A8S1AWU0_ARCPL|nr:unnamed protein product [Arctia plantaginis]
MVKWKKKFPEVHNSHEPKNHHDDCYFCVVSSRRSVDLPSAKQPTLVPILAQEPIPLVLPSASAAASCQMETDDIIDDDKSNDPDFIPNATTTDLFNHNRVE